MQISYFPANLHILHINEEDMYDGAKQRKTVVLLVKLVLFQTIPCLSETPI